MLSRPAQALADLEVARGIQDFLQANPNLTEPREGTTRDELIAATLSKPEIGGRSCRD